MAGRIRKMESTLEYPIFVLESKLTELQHKLNEIKEWNRIVAPHESNKAMADVRTDTTKLEEDIKNTKSAISVLHNHGAAKNSA
ncbi:MAG: hypothetical protein CMF23_17915 [Ignavibacteriae bacterium]|nr:hypothetical protein [Ignavibacteriota bacterium]